MEKLLLAFLGLMFFFALTGCRKDEIRLKEKPIGYDIILVMGQSNTHFGLGIDSLLDETDSRIQQLGRFDSNNYKMFRKKHRDRYNLKQLPFLF